MKNANHLFGRRQFLQTACLGTAGAAWQLSAAAAESQAAEGVCVTLCNHWSYLGIGWQLGIESVVLSATDAMEMADRPPGVKTCINLDARACEFLAEKFPEVAARFKKYLAAGKVELIGGTYGQPMGTTISGESNIRQIVLGRETILKALDYELATFLEEEEFSHPQLPQLVVGAGFKYASLAQLDTWGRAGIPVIEVNALRWQGLDGTTIPSTPRNPLFGYNPDLKQLAALPAFARLQRLGKPLLFTWAEFGWESPEAPSYLTAPESYRKLAADMPVEFVTLKEYMDKYGARPRETAYLNMDSWHKSLTWGIGGDQLRILDRQVEGLLLAAERFDAVASALGFQPHTAQLRKAWKNLLASQSHDVGLCEYSRWQGDRMAPLDRVEDLHNFTWGALGYQHLDAAQAQGREVLDAALGSLAGRIGSAPTAPGPWTITVFNPSGWTRSEVALTGRIYPIPPNTRGLVVKDATGQTLPSQVIKREADAAGNLEMAELAFVADQVPSVGYRTFYLAPASPAEPPAATGLRVDEAGWGLENEHLKLRLDPKTGAVGSLVDKKSGREMLAGSAGAFPIFKGRPNPDYPLRSIFGSKNVAIPAFYDSAQSQAEIQWLEKGPLRARIRARHHWPLLKFETHITLAAGSRHVEVLSRVLAEVPPATDASPPDINEGYWLSFKPGFQPATVWRDFPFGVEPTVHARFHGLTFVDLAARDFGLLVLHAGTQYFRQEKGGAIANLLMREWESFWTGEYGWPRYAEYRHALLPHGADFTHADRLRAAAQFGQGLLSVVGQPHPGDLPLDKSFLSVTPAHALLSAFRRREGNGFELRVVETDGRESAVSASLALPWASAVETDLLGNQTGTVEHRGSQLEFRIPPWKVKTFSVA